jgi:hypothetical protein
VAENEKPEEEHIPLRVPDKARPLLYLQWI